MENAGPGSRGTGSGAVQDFLLHGASILFFALTWVERNNEITKIVLLSIFSHERAFPYK